MGKRQKPKIRVFGDADHNASIYILIGQLIIHWSNSESVLLRILMALIGNEGGKAQTVFYSHKNTNGRLDLIMTLTRSSISDKFLVKDVEVAISTFKGMSRTRNFFAHSMYDYNINGQMLGATGVIFDNQTGVFRWDSKPFNAQTLNEINDANTRSIELNRSLWKLALKIDAYFGRKPTLPPELLPELQDELREAQAHHSAPQTAPEP